MPWTGAFPVSFPEIEMHEQSLGQNLMCLDGCKVLLNRCSVFCVQRLGSVNQEAKQRVFTGYLISEITDNDLRGYEDFLS